MRLRVSGYVLIVLILGFAGSRLLVRLWLGLAPDPAILENHWQHSDLAWLHNMFWETILYMHSQPPLWNALIGAVTQVVGPAPEQVAWGVSSAYMVLSFLMMCAFVRLARQNGFSPWAAAFIGLLIAVSPTTLYYEFYPFYPHFTAFLVTCLLVAATGLHKGTFGPVLALFLSAVLLSWTWGVFHPVFVVLLGGLCLVLYPATRSPGGVGIILGAFLLSYLPTLKNDLLFGQDTASSWLGINLTQTLPDRDAELMSYCRFETVVEALVAGTDSGAAVGVISVDALVKPSSGEANMNNLLVAQRAEACFDLYLAQAPQDPLGLVSHLGARLIDSHSMPPFIYGFRPAGWNSSMWVERGYYKLGLVSQGLCLLSYASLMAFAVWRCWQGPNRALYVLIVAIIVYFTLITHLANGIEQQRMRATIAPLYWFVFISLLADLRARLGSSRRSEGSLSAGG